MSKLLLAVAIALLTGLLGYKCGAADKDAEKSVPKWNPRQIECKLLIKKRKRKDAAGDFDDKIQLLYYTPEIYNRSSVDLEGLQLEVHLIGQSVVEKKIFSIIELATYPLAIKSKKTFSPEERLLANKYDNQNSYRTGYIYYTYVIVIKDKNGKVLLVKCPKTKFNKFMDSLIKLTKDKQFDDKGRPLKL